MTRGAHHPQFRTAPEPGVPGLSPRPGYRVSTCVVCGEASPASSHAQNLAAWRRLHVRAAQAVVRGGEVKA